MFQQNSDLQINMVLYAQLSINNTDGSWVNTATFSGCNYTFTADLASINPFGAGVMPDCNNTGVSPDFRPIVFWFFTHETTPPKGAATYCAPAISIFEVSTTLYINNVSLTSVVENQPFNASASGFASLAKNVTGLPLNGQALNGIAVDLTNPDPFTLSKLNATKMQLSASILQVASKAPGGMSAAFQSNNFTESATMVYVSG
jgi:hypothetical protein